MKGGKCIKTGLSLSEEMLAAVKAKAGERCRGNVSAYVQDLIAADLAAKRMGAGVSERVLEELAEVYAGYLAPQLTQALRAQRANQPALLHQMLCRAFLDAGGSPDEVNLQPLKWRVGYDATGEATGLPELVNPPYAQGAGGAR